MTAPVSHEDLESPRLVGPELETSRDPEKGKGLQEFRTAGLETMP